MFCLLDQTARISTNLSHLTGVHDGQGDHSSHYHHLHALEIMPNIRTSRHSTHYEFIREGRKGESLLFLPGIDTLFRGERNNFWLKNDGWNWLEESRKRIAFPLVLWLSLTLTISIFTKMAENYSFPRCYVQVFLINIFPFQSPRSILYFSNDRQSKSWKLLFFVAQREFSTISE